jgi:hypothetical protein
VGFIPDPKALSKIVESPTYTKAVRAAAIVLHALHPGRDAAEASFLDIPPEVYERQSAEWLIRATAVGLISSLERNDSSVLI